jgi:glutamine---fructose-6-phosphate transaminase (isomerizing)
MNIHSQVHGAPRALKETLEKGRPEFDEIVRKTSWGNGPLFIVGSGSSYPAALAGMYAFEEFLGWPVVAAHAANFLAYAASTLRPRSVVMTLASGEEADPALEVARQARVRGAAVLAMTHDAASPLAESADGVFLVRTEEGEPAGLQAQLCRYAAMGFLAAVAAHVLKRHHQKLDELERDYRQLPEHAEWVLTRLGDAARSLASEIGNGTQLVLAGGGPYYPAALQAAGAMTSLTSVRARAVDAAEMAEAQTNAFEKPETLLLFSCSRSRSRKTLAGLARTAARAGARVLSITDANHRELIEASALGILLPPAGELPGSALALFFAHCTISHLSRPPVHPAKQSTMKPATSKGKPEVI